MIITKHSTITVFGTFTALGQPQLEISLSRRLRQSMEDTKTRPEISPSLLKLGRGSLRVPLQGNSPT